jgi:acyl-CoA hydrolase
VRLVLCAEGPCEPQAALSHYLASQPPTPADPVHLVFGMRRTPPQLPLPLSPYFTVGTFVPGRGLRDIQPLTYHRRAYSEICRDLATGAFLPDVTIACATPPGEDGRRSLGAIVGYLDLAVQVSRTFVVEEVSWLPVVPGAAQVRRADDVVIAEAGRPEKPARFSAPFDAVDEAIAANVASLLPDNPRLALGIGRIPDALAAALGSRGDIDIITGVVTDTVRRLSEAGALGGQPIRSMSVVGPRSLLDWSAEEDRVELSSSTTIHDPGWLAQQDRFVCVLGALDVDTAGNVNAERVGSRAVSGRGGAPDFARGAHDSTGGLSVVALSSRDATGGSRLVDRVDDPSLDATIVDAVVTENGAAVLTGLGANQRRDALRRIF